MRPMRNSALSGPREDQIPTGPSRRRLLWPLSAAAVVFLARWGTTNGRTVFTSGYDEGSQLAMARTLTGDVDWHTASLTYRPGYATLLAPVHWITSDPTSTYRAALLLNALLGAVAVLLLIGLARAITTVSLKWCSTLALVTSLTAGTLLHSGYARPESLIAVLFLATMLASIRLVAQPSLRSGLLAVAFAAAGYATHGRMGTLAASVLLIVGVLVARRRLAIRDGFALLAATVVLTWLVQQYSEWIVDRTWIRTSSTNSLGTILRKLLDPLGTLEAILGMTWYQLVTTVGIVGAGVWVISAAIIRPAAPTGLGLSRPDALVISVTSLPAMAITAVFAADPEYASQIVYGRYWDAIAGPILLLGLLVLFRGTRAAVRRSSAIAFAAIVGTGALLWLLRQADLDDAIDRFGGVRPGGRIFGLIAYIPDVNALSIVRITTVAATLCAVVGAMALLRWRFPAVLGALIVLLLALGTVAGARALDITERGQDRLATAGGVTEAVEGFGLSAGSEVGIDLEGPWRILFQRWMAYQFHLPDHPVTVYRPEDGHPPPYVIAWVDNPRWADSAELVWKDPGSPIGLWATNSP